MSTTMTKGEREDLQRLVRQRERVQKSAAKQRSNELMADFEAQMAAEYSFNDDAVWAAATKAAEAEVAKAQEAVAARCEQMGIPRQFAPSLRLAWHHRGYGNSLDSRRAELRRVAKAQIEALEQQAIVHIEQASVNAQTQIAIAGLTSEAAQALVANLPTVESLMPALSYDEVAGGKRPGFVERLITPPALRRENDQHEQLADGSPNVAASSPSNQTP